MRRIHAIRSSALLALGGITGGLGCTHNHYYAMPATQVGQCDPMLSGTVVSSTTPVSGTPVLGAVCDEPPQGRAGLMAFQGQSGARPIVSNAARPINPQPIVSQPAGRGSRRPGGLVWRNSVNESLASTHIEGAYEDDTTIK